jgi:c-di-AMP phosphodiesterase-like protein
MFSLVRLTRCLGKNVSTSLQVRIGGSPGGSGLSAIRTRASGKINGFANALTDLDIFMTKKLVTSEKSHFADAQDFFSCSDRKRQNCRYFFDFFNPDQIQIQFSSMSERCVVADLQIDSGYDSLSQIGDLETEENTKFPTEDIIAMENWEQENTMSHYGSVVKISR